MRIDQDWLRKLSVPQLELLAAGAKAELRRRELESELDKLKSQFSA